MQYEMQEQNVYQGSKFAIIRSKYNCVAPYQAQKKVIHLFQF